jgi:hypothetical protein
MDDDVQVLVFRDIVFAVVQPDMPGKAKEGIRQEIFDPKLEHRRLALTGGVQGDHRCCYLKATVACA